MLVFAAFTVQAQKNVFKILVSDKPDPAKAILMVTYNGYGELYVTKGNIVYVTPYMGNKDDITTKGDYMAVRYYYVDPGEYEFIAFSQSVVTGETDNPYVSHGVVIKTFPFSGIFKLEAGKAYYFGYIETKIPTITERGRTSIDPNGEQTCNVVMSPERLTFSKLKFQNDKPKIFYSVKGEIEPVTFLPTQKMYVAGNVLFDEKFADNTHGWQTSNDGTKKSYISDNSLIIENNGVDSCVLTLPVNIPKSFDLRLETTWIGGDNRRDFGLIIGNDNVNCLKFTITNNGYFCVKRWNYFKGIMYQNPMVEGWQKHDCIQTGDGAKNVIKVQKMQIQGLTYGMIAFYINDVLVAHGPYLIDQRSAQFDKKGVIGVFSFGKQNVAFNRMTFTDY